MTQTLYGSYKLSLMEYLLYGLIYLSVSGIISYLFYDSLIPILFIIPFMNIYYRYISHFLCNKRKSTLILQFRDMINSISVSLNSGYSIENSLKDANREILILYGKNSYIHNEINIMLKKLAINIPIEKIFSDFAMRSECNDIIMFSQILVIAKRNGGDLISIIKSSSETIGEKIDIKREIESAVSSKKFEQNIMFLMPVVIMLYIRISSRGFYDSVYHNMTGVFFMTICLLIYISAIIIGLKLSTVKI